MSRARAYGGESVRAAIGHQGGWATERKLAAILTADVVGYSRLMEQDEADTLRFYALRLRELGMIKSSPQKVIANSKDWRFLNELKRELKG
jgi:NitT/TauT family transport system substrate-binding protein